MNIELTHELSSDVIVTFTDYIKITKSETITVPNTYRAFAFIDRDRAEFRIDPCNKKNIFKDKGKEVLGKEIRFAYVMSGALPEMKYGFGNVQVNNSRLKDAYRVGANGSYYITISDMGKFIKSFGFEDTITIDDIREKTLSIIKSVGTQVLAQNFANTDVSVFEISAKMDEIKANMTKSLSNEELFSELGIKLKSIIVTQIFVNPEDLQRIRDNINNGEE